MNATWGKLSRALKGEYLSLDRRVLGVFRIAYGLVLLYDLGRRAAVLTLAYSNEGVLSNHYVMFAPQSEFQFSLLDAFSTPNEVRLAFALIAIAYVLYTLGLFTRVTSLLALIAITSLNARNLFVEDGGVSTLIALGVWSAFLPVGERLSLDALRSEASLASVRQRSALRQRSSQPFVSLAVLALGLQICAIYWLNAAHKSGATWHHGEAVHYVLWQRRVVTDFGFWLAHHEPAWLSPLATQATLITEWLLPVFALAPFGIWPRLIAFFMALGLHGGIALVMTLGPFSYAMLVLVGLRLPWPVFAALGRRAPRRLRLRLARWRALALRWLRRAPFDIARLSPPREPVLPWRAPLREGLVILLAYVSLVDMSASNRDFPLHLPRPRWARSIALYPRFVQRWNMFSPDAPTDDGAGVIDAVTKSGRHVDPFTGDEPNFDVLERGPLPHGGILTDYLFQLHFDQARAYRPELMRYLREWHQHEGRGESDRIIRFDFWWLTRPTPAPGASDDGPTERQRIFRGP